MPSQSAYSASVEAPVGGAQFCPRTRQNVALGSLHLRICSNEDPFSELQYFPERIRLPEAAPVHFTINCCNTNMDGPWPLQYIHNAQDRTYRAGRFAGGYYLTDHFGPPSYMITRGRQLWIFAPHFSPILWPFVVKYLLTVYSIDQQMLHLKAAAVSLQGTVTLLVGRGGTGKTVLLTRLCSGGGAQFLANTHVLVQDGLLTPVASAMRVRKGVLFDSIVAARKLPPAIKPGEYLADPFEDLGWNVGAGGRIRNICLLDYRQRQEPVVCDLDADVMFDYMESFSLALNIYGLREDVLDYLGADVRKFSAECSLMKTRLRQLIGACRSLYISADATDPKILEDIRGILIRSSAG